MCSSDQVIFTFFVITIDDSSTVQYNPNYILSDLKKQVKTFMWEPKIASYLVLAAIWVFNICVPRATVWRQNYHKLSKLNHAISLNNQVTRVWGELIAVFRHVKGFNYTLTSLFTRPNVHRAKIANHEKLDKNCCRACSLRLKSPHPPEDARNKHWVRRSSINLQRLC